MLGFSRSASSPLLAVLGLLAPAVTAQEPARDNTEDAWSVLVPADVTDVDDIAALAATVRPHPRQHRWLQLGFTAFVHFGMNTFSDREWGDGQEDPDTFQPVDFDPDQWCRAFAAAGMRGLVLTCKHHDGFCLWPTRTTAHSVASTSWRDGQADIVGEVAAACRRHGLQFGIYLSPWDRNAPSFGTKAYDDLFHAQLRELLADYGEIYDVWFDGAHAPKDDPDTFDWTRHYRLVRELQPGACVSVTGPDVRWCGNEAGVTRDAEWNVIPLDTRNAAAPTESYDVLGAYFRVPKQARKIGGRAQLAGAGRLVWWPAMTNTSIRPGWFWHASQDPQVKPLDHLLDVYYGAVGGGTQFLLNVPPNDRGLVAAGDVDRLQQIGKVLRATFDVDLAEPATLAEPTATSKAWQLDLPSPRAFDVIRLQEDVAAVGQRIESFAIEVPGADGLTWREIHRGGTVGPQRLIRLDTPVTAGAVRCRVLASRAPARLNGFSLHRRPAVLRAPRITRDAAGVVTLQADAGDIHFTVDGSEPGPDSPRYKTPFALEAGGVVRATAIAAPDRTAADQAVLDLGLAATASRHFGLCRALIRLHGASSEQAPGEAAELAIDGDPDTLWHSRWSPDTPGHPHWLALDLGRVRAIHGFVYTPRHDNSNGTITSYDLEVSHDGSSWQTVMEDQEFANIVNNPVPQTVRLEPPTDARYLRIKTRSAADDKPWASIAELEVLVR